MTKRHKTTPHNWTPGQLSFLRIYCRTLSDSELRERFNQVFGTNLTPSQIKGARRRHNMLTGRTGRFKKGMTRVPNSGAKGATSTSFKKGHRPHNYLPVGTEVVKNKSDDLVYVKIADPGVWQSKHSLIWEQHHGQKVPTGHIVLFADGDRRNFEVANLVLMARGELADFNKRGWAAACKQVRPTLTTLARLHGAVRRKRGKA